MNRHRGWVAALLIVVLVGVPTAVWAHARLTKSDPAAKSHVAIVPSQIRLWFSEAPEVALTRVGLTDSAGHVVELGPVERDSARLAVHVQIRGSLAAGRYSVTWRTAAADGHPADGAFSFTVMPGAAAIVGATAVVGDTTRARSPIADTSKKLHRTDTTTVPGLDSPGALAATPVAVRAISFTSLLLLVGAIVFRFGVAARAPVAESMRRAMRTRAARLGAWSAAVLLLSAVARFVLQVQMMNDNAVGADTMQTMALRTHWGAVWLLQVITAIVALFSLVAARRDSKHAWSVAAIAVLVVAVTPALGGHAAALSRFTTLAIVTDALHVVAASAWLGTLAHVVLVAVPEATRGGEDERWVNVASLVNLYSPLALAAGATVAATGLVSAWLRLEHPSALWTSEYGRVLLIKLALLIGVVVTGAFNWLRVRPALGTAVATTQLRRSAAVELAIGVLVIIVTAVLVATQAPVPPSAG
jgi:copper transport protein